MTPPLYSLPDFGPMLSFWMKQTEFALEMQGRTMQAMLAPMTFWHGMPGVMMPKPAAPQAAPAKTKPASKPAPKAKAEAAEVVTLKASVSTPEPTPAAVVVSEPKTAAPKPAGAAPKPATAKAVTPAPKPVAKKPLAEAKPAAASVTKPAAKAKPAAPKTTATPEKVKPAPAKAKTPAKAKAAPKPDPSKPMLLDAPRAGKGDDLTAIKGVGPKLAGALNKAGIWHYDQLLDLTPKQAGWIDDTLGGVPGRALRDDWSSQAKALIKG